MQPHYEKVARLFNGPNAVHPGIILMTRVDCALKVFTLRLLNFFPPNMQYVSSPGNYSFLKNKILFL